MAGLADGIARVDAQIGHELVELAGVDLHGADVPAGLPDQLDFLADQAAQHGKRVLDGLVEIQDDGRGDLLAGEGLQLLREGRGPLGGLLDFPQVGMERLVRRHLLDGHFDVAEDGLERIVEVVGHAARQAAHGFQLLGVGELGLQGLLLLLGAELLGDVALDGHVIDHVAGGVAHGGNGGLLGAQRAVLALVDDLAFPGLAGLQGAPQVPVEFRVVLAALEQARILAEHFLAGIAGGAGEGGIHVEDGALGVGDEDGFAGLFDGANQPLVLGFRPLARGDVGDEAFQGEHLALLVVDAFALFPDPLGFAGTGADFVFLLEPAPLAERLLPFGPHEFALGRQDEVGEGDGLVADEILRGVAGQVLAALADELHGPVPVVPAAVGHARQVGHQGHVLAPAFPKLVFGQPAFGHVVEDAGELAGRGAEDRHFEVAADGRREVVEERGIAGQRHVAVGFDANRFGLRQDFAAGLADDVGGFPADHAFEGGIHRQEAIVAGAALLVADDFVQREAFDHVVEQGAIVFFGVLAVGDVARGAVQFDAAGLRMAPEAGHGLGDHGAAVLAGLAQLEREEGVRREPALLEFAGALREHGPELLDFARQQGVGDGAGHDLFGRVAAQLLDRRADVEVAQRVGVHDPHHVLHAFRQRAVLPLAFAQGFFGAPAIGDVARGAVDFEPARALVLPEAADGFAFDEGAVAAHERRFHGEELVGRQSARPDLGRAGAQPFAQPVALGGGDRRREGLVGDLRGREAQQLLDRRADVEEAQRVGVHEPHDVLHALRQHAVFLLVFAQRFVGAHALGDVDVRAHGHGRGAARRVGQRLAAGPDPRPAAVLAPHPVALVVQAPPGIFQIGEQVRASRVPIARMDQVQPQRLQGLPLRRKLEFPGLVAELREVFRAAPHPLRRGVVFPRAAVRGPDQRRVAVRRHLVFLREPRHGFLDAFALGDVGVGAPEPLQVAVLVAEGDAAAGEPNELARFGHGSVEGIDDGLARAQQFQALALEFLPGFRGTEVVEMQLADDFVRTIAENRFGHVADGDVEAVDVDFPRDDAALARQQAVMVHAFGQFPVLFFHQPGQMLAALGEEPEDPGDETGEQQPQRRQQPDRAGRVQAREIRRRPRHQHVGVAEDQQRPGHRQRRPGRQVLQRFFPAGRRRRTQPDRRLAEPQLPKVENGGDRFVRRLVRAGVQPLRDVQSGDEHSGLASGFAGARGAAHHEDLATGAAVLQERIFRKNGRQAGLPDGVQFRAPLRVGAEVVALRRSVRVHRRQVRQRIVARPFAGGRRRAVGAGLPDPELRPARPLRGGGFELRAIRAGHRVDPTPERHARHGGQLRRIEVEFPGIHQHAAFEEGGERVDLQVAQVRNGVEDRAGFDLRQLSERAHAVARFGLPNAPRQRGGQHRADRRNQRGFGIGPEPERAVAVRMPPRQMAAEQPERDQRQAGDARHDRGARAQAQPAAGFDVDAQNGEQFSRAQVPDRHIGADPDSPAVRHRAFGDRFRMVEHALQHVRRFFVRLARRRRIRRVVGLGVHLEKDRAVRRAAHQVDPLPVRIDLLRRHQLFLQAAVFGLGGVALVPGQPAEMVPVEGLHEQARLVQQVFPHALVFADDRPFRVGEARRQQRQRARRRDLQEPGLRRSCQSFRHDVCALRMRSGRVPIFQQDNDRTARPQSRISAPGRI